jgi:outer membrane lipase/esterase
MMKIRGIALAIALLAPSLAHAASFSTFYVFGDSLVDAGNIKAATGGAVPSASEGYFEGRFTNGYDYTDLLSISAFGAPTVASLEGGNNFAFGGARVVTNADFVPDLGFQLGAYTSRVGGVADPDALYILTFGGNDVFALGSGDTGALTPSQYATAVATQYAGGVQYLNSIGARNILITGIPNALDPAASALEAQLQTSIDALTLTPDTNLYRFSFLDFFNTVTTDPGALGLPPLRTDTTCLRARGPSPAPDCTGFFFFDDVHPTAAVQSAAAREINRQFSLVPAPVPEPMTWTMMIIGFGVTGAAMRRQRSQVRLAARNA